MNIFQLCIFGSLFFDIVVGLVVLLTSARRTANQAFLILSLVLGAYMTCFACGSMADNEASLTFWIRQTSAVSTLVPWSLNLLRLAITTRDRWPAIFRRSWYFHVMVISTIILSQTPWFVTGAHLPQAGQTVAVPVYGPALKIFSAYFLVALGLLLGGYAVDFRRSSGMRRSELEFVLMASGFGVFFGIAFFLAPIIFGNQELGQFLPLVVIVIDGFIAYGIATRRILDVPQVLSRIVAYLLLAVYLGLVYAAAWFPTDLLVRHVVHTSLTLPHFIAVFAVVVSVVPAHGRLQEFVNRLMGMTRAFDATAMLNRGLHVLGSISTLDELLAQFAAVVQAGVGTDRVVLLLREDGHFRQAYPPAGSRMEIPDDDAIPALLRDQHEPLSADLLPRYTYTAGVAQAINRLAELQVSVAVGIETKGRLETLMLLGPRLSGRIYATPELTTLQLLSNHLGVALENAKLYTQVQDNAIYTNNLLEHLVSGVIAAGPDRRITVFNREAQRISGMTPADTMGRSISCLPAPLYDMLNDVYAIGAGPREKELVLNSDRREDQLTLRAGSTLFHGSKGQMLGALLVFHDVSAVKRLESQVRRGDRLASMGTLAAGMAHEIKNPLQTLKTFTQLLGERYDDPEFRGSFTDLVGSEVQRIDTIVNQLLRFARPAKPVLVPIHVHSVVENTLRLLQQQMKQRNITAVRKLDAPSDFIRGDADLLHQAMINFFLNAVDAMPAGGSLTLRTEIIAPAGSHRNGGSAEASLRLSISDSGTGIGPDVIPHIFDPFYTTKNTGTGLGLSVSHGIITEHGGFIDVESVPQHGTTFHLHFPLCTAEVPA